MIGATHRRVTVLLANVKHFRGPFYSALAERLSFSGVELRVLYSEPERKEALKQDCIELPAWLGSKVPRLYSPMGRLLLQFPNPYSLAKSDLIIVVQAAGYLVNYPLLLLARLGLKKVAFWGHGWNRQGDAKSLAERTKRHFATWCNWWFAYTENTKAYLISLGVGQERMTVIENAIDTEGFRNQVNSVTSEEMAEIRAKYSLDESNRIGIFCGSLYAEKRLEFLVSVARKVAAERKEFRLIIVGAGSEQRNMELAQGEYPDVLRYVGPAFGREKAALFRLAEVVLNPGLVGLGILDSFAAGLPFLTSPNDKHGPEISYLVENVNGLIIPGDAHDYAAAVLRVLHDHGTLERLRLGAVAASGRYTLSNMVKNVEKGILSCLAIESVDAVDSSSR